MTAQAEQLNNQMRKDLNIEIFGKALDQGWQLKRSLASTITTNSIDAWYQAALDAGAMGGKICGAGGGGFLLFVTPLEKHKSVRNALSDLKELLPKYEPRGSIRLLVD
jgi:D-glycero-alpha-D-manno-heptose-7-phosphate kinase